MFGRFVFESGKYVFLSTVATSLRDASFKGYYKDEYEKLGYQDSRRLYTASVRSIFNDIENERDLNEIVEEEISDIEYTYKCDSESSMGNRIYKNVEIQETLDCMREFVYNTSIKLMEYVNSFNESSILVNLNTQLGVELVGFNIMDYYREDKIDDLLKYVDSNKSAINMQQVLTEGISYMYIPRTNKNHSILSLGNMSKVSPIGGRFSILHMHSKEGIQVVSKEVGDVRMSESAKALFHDIESKGTESVWELQGERYLLGY